MQSLDSSLTLNNLIFFTIYFSFVYFSFDKIGPLRIDKIRTLANWQKKYPPDWQKQDPFRIGKIGTPPDWDPSGIVKIAFPGL